VTRENMRAALAAAVILGGFGLTGYFMPTIMLAIGKHSPAAAGVVAVLFAAGYFIVFYLRGRSQKRK
jgi:hypothetical protein